MPSTSKMRHVDLDSPLSRFLGPHGARFEPSPSGLIFLSIRLSTLLSKH